MTASTSLHICYNQRMDNDDEHIMDAFGLRFQLQLTVINSKENNRRKKTASGKRIRRLL